VISRVAAGAADVMPSEEVEAAPEGTTERAHALAAAAVHRVWDRVAVVAVAEEAAVGAGRTEKRSNEMKSISANKNLLGLAWAVSAIAMACLSVPALLTAQQSETKEAPPAAAATPSVAPTAGAKTFDSPQQAADALINAAEQWDETTLIEIFGPGGDDIVLTGELAQDRQRAADFAAEAREKKTVSVDPKTGNRAFLIVGNEEWPFPVPIVKAGNKWHFDAAAGIQELLYRRIGANELDAIQICHGYVEAQEDYAMQPREGYNVNQYAQRIISTPGTQDGLAWRNADGAWEGPIGAKIAEAIEQGYSNRAEPYHGYFFKVLKGQGPDAPLGQMDYVVKGVMIGGFALVAAPAEYRVTGVQTFIVSNDGVVYQKDFGPTTLDEFKKMELFNPDKSWTPVPDEDD